MNKNKYVIETGIGLQDVDRLKNSSYFSSEANRYINGEISLEELDDIISSYYINKPSENDRSDEADIVAVRIAKLISSNSFTFSVGELMSIHKYLFDGLIDNPGQLRKYNITKKEWVLNGETVVYADYRELDTILQYDFQEERKFDYRGLSIDQAIEHLAFFAANIWQIHAFIEGNTRTTAVFLIKYLKSLGFDVTNDAFAKYSWYFRNSLVRANYSNLVKGIYEDRTYLIKFLRNLLLNENNTLENKYLHVSMDKKRSKNDSRNIKILDAIKRNANITTDALSKEIGVSLRTIKCDLKAMENDKQIKRVNGKRYGHWKIL